MVQNILQFIVVVAVSFGALVLLTSFFRFQNKVAGAEALDEAAAVGVGPFTYRLAGRLASGPREPDPCLVVRVELCDLVERLGPLSGSDLDALRTFMTGRLRSCIREKDAVVCLEPGRHGLLVGAGLGQAEAIARRIAGAFEDDVFSLKAGGGIPLHVRVGAAACPQDGTGVDALLSASAEAVAAAGPETAWALASHPEPAAEPASDTADPLADVPASQRHLVDPSTGVLSEEHLGITMQRFVARTHAKGRPASIVCLGIGQFERYGELYGAEGAGQLLAHLARILKHSVREDDLLARYGQGRFVIMLGCEPALALRVAARIGAALQARPLALAGSEILLKLTAGVAGCPDHGTVPSDILKLALNALARAGTDGRAPFVVYEHDMAAHHAQHAPREAF